MQTSFLMRNSPYFVYAQTGAPAFKTNHLSRKPANPSRTSRRINCIVSWYVQSVCALLCIYLLSISCTNTRRSRAFYHVCLRTVPYHQFDMCVMRVVCDALEGFQCSQLYHIEAIRHSLHIRFGANGFHCDNASRIVVQTDGN